MSPLSIRGVHATGALLWRRRVAVLAVLWAAVAARGDHLDERFVRPPIADRPWAYWWWLKANVDEATITRDLEAMKQVGFGGLLHFDVRGYHEDHVLPPPERTEFMSPEWRRLLVFSLKEAARLGLEVSVNLSSCAGALKGPWPVGADAPKRLVWCVAEIEGPARLDCQLPAEPGPGYHDVALLALRHAGGAAAPPRDHGLVRLADDAPWLDESSPPVPRPMLDGPMVDLTDKHDAEGRVTWEVPPGRWSVVRFGWVVVPDRGYDVDVLDEEAVGRHFDRMGRAILSEAGPLAGSTLTHFYSVSWEGAAPTWTPRFETEFEANLGYPIRPWLPALAGFVVRDEVASARFIDDYYTALAGCFMDRFYGALQRLCGDAGLRWHAEAGGPWNRKLAAFARADQLAFLGRTDMPQGEFWFPGHGRMDRPTEFNRPAAMAAHIYGRPLAAAEAFTHMAQHWSAYPAALKPTADAAFCDGINHLIWHTFTASPSQFGLPGVEYFAGTHINPNVTWFPMASAFIDYLARCQVLLRHGRFVADLCVYLGDRPYQHWKRGPAWGANATLSAPRGHGYDIINNEVLLGRMEARDGRLVLPDGMEYRALVVDLDDEAVRPDVLRKIVALTEQGAAVILGRRRPGASSTLNGYPDSDDDVRALAKRLWGRDEEAPARETFGQGVVFRRTSVAEALRALSVSPDVEGPWDYTHRAGNGIDVYFVAGDGEAEVAFRAAGRMPELWDPTTGAIRPAPAWRSDANGRTRVWLSMPTNGSVFVVFRSPPPDDAPALISEPAGVEQIAVASGRRRLRVWRSGGVELTNTAGRVFPVTAAPVPEPMKLRGPWRVSFEPERGAPASAEFSELMDWTHHPDPGIRFFAGRATYRKAFELTAAQAAAPMRIELGGVGVIARVRLNGRDLGVVWTPPWRVDAGDAAREGANELEVDVANVWMNRLIGDAGLPPEKRIARSNVTLEPSNRTVRVFQGFGATDRLQPSGLFGPVRLVFGRLAEADL